MRTLSLILAVIALALLAGCKAESLRRSADRADAVAADTDALADTVDRTFATAEQALAWATDPVNQAVIELLPAGLQARITAVLDAGGDLRPVLASAAVEIRTIASEIRDSATRFREQADAEDTAFENFIAAVGIGSAAFGGIGVAIGRVFGIGLGAARVTQMVNAARVEDPAFEAAIQGAAGEVLTRSLSHEGNAVRRAVLKHKASSADINLSHSLAKR